MGYIKERIKKLKNKANVLKREVGALYLAYKRKDVPWHAKIFALIVVGYAMSPIDLIPDFIPVLGYLDDLILIPLGIAIAVKLIPEKIMQECRDEAEKLFKDKKLNSWIAGGIILLIWVIIFVFVLKRFIK